MRFDLRCGPGTYVRSIARDLGERLGCGGHLQALRRTEAAGLLARDGIGPDRLEALAADGRLAEALLPVEPLLPLAPLRLGADEAWRFMHGAVQAVAPDAPIGRVKVLDPTERLIGIGAVSDAQLRPEKVIPQDGGG